MDVFFENLANKKNEVLGIKLYFNKLWILFYKCLCLRRKKKFLSVLEFVLPLIFTYFYFNNVQKNLSPTHNNAEFLKLTEINFDKSPFITIKNLYYSDSPDEDFNLIENYLNYFSFFKIRFEEQNLFEEQEESSLLLHFDKINKTNVVNELSIKDIDNYEDYNKLYKDHPNLVVSSIETIYYYIYKNLCLLNNIEPFKLVLDNFDLNLSKKDTNSNNQVKSSVFTNLFQLIVFILFINSFQFMGEITEEKKNGLFENLKLMGATNAQIIISHFLNHFIVWMISLLISTLYIKINLDLSFTTYCYFLLFITLFVTHFLVFMFLVAAIFQNLIICNIVIIISVIFSSFLEEKYISIYIFFPSYVFSIFIEILKDLTSFFDFENNFFEIFYYKSLQNSNLSIFFLSIIITVIIIYEFFLTIYVLEIHPLQKGIRKPYFYFLRSFRLKFKPILIQSTEENSSKIEKVSNNAKPAIILKNVDKTYYPKFFKCFGYYKVLKDFNFTIYKNQITVLLGHNGSGKSTLMNLVSGLLKKDNGLIFVEEEFVNYHSDEYKKKLSFCTQENVFYDNLTVYQNLKIAAIIKRMPFTQLNNIIENLTEFFDLTPKLNEFAGSLSGGMKRRLCLALSIIGYNEILLIDEATSGLDVATKRKVWDVLLELRKYRTILLTTHFLEEADILGDRIAIMNEGKIECCGSSMFLKKIFNVGYQLRVLTKNNINAEKFLQFIKKYIPNSTLENQISNEYFFRMMSTENDFNLKMADFLDHLDKEENLNKFNIVTYGLENTSLEDIFIKINTVDKDSKESHETQLNIDTSEDHPFKNLNKLTSYNLLISQFKAIFFKKLDYAISNILFVITPTVYFTIIILILVIAVQKVYNYNLSNNNFSVSNFGLKDNYKNLIGVVIDNDNDTVYIEDDFPYFKNEFGLDLSKEKSNSIKNIVSKKKKELGDNVFQEKFLLIIDKISPSQYKFYLNPYFSSKVQVGIIDFFYKSFTSKLSADLKFNFLEATKDSYGRKFGKYMEIIFFFELLFLIYSLIILTSPFMIFIDYLLQEKNSPSLKAQKIAGLSSLKFWIMNFIFDYFYTIMFILFGILIVFISSSGGVIFYYKFETILGFCFCILNSLLLVYFLANLGLRRQTTELFMQLFLYIPGIISSVYLIIIGLVTVTEKKVEIPFNFTWLIFSPIFNLFSILTSNGQIYLKNKCIINLPQQASQCERLNPMEFSFLKNYLASFIFSTILILMTVLMNKNIKLVLLLQEKLKNFSFTKKNNLSENSSDTKLLNLDYLSNIKEDENVIKEKNYVQHLCDTNQFDITNNILIANDLRKIYSDKEVVKGLNFTVKRNECLGLLGVNGAGKTTAFSILTGTILASSGQVFLNSYSLKDEQNYLKYLAYCPQENTGFEKITVEQNLKFYARLCGIPSDKIKQVVATIIEQCDLKEHTKKHADKLSGGNKRKLSIAIALIGNKELVLLDEPTTGVDASSRRHLWKTFTFFKKNFLTSFILTSHSMDECQNLCERISIMVAGKFKCLGTFSYLRDKYAQGFTISIRLKDEKNNENYINDIKQNMNVIFGSKAELKEFYMNTLIYIIMSQEFKWSFLFRAMENLKNKFDLDDFMISGTNLEQIFLSFSN